MENKKLLNIQYVEDTHSIDNCGARQLACKILENVDLEGEEYYKKEDKLTDLLNEIAKRQELPNKVTISEDELGKDIEERLVDFINEYLADVYGYCNNGFSYNVNIEIEDIDWDLEE